MPKDNRPQSNQVNNKRIATYQEFPNYEKHFGRFTFMVKNIEREIGVSHFNTTPLDKNDYKEILKKSETAKKHEDYIIEDTFLKKTIKRIVRKISENEEMYYENMEDVVRRGNRLPGLDSLSDDPVMKGKMLARMAAQNRNQYKRSERSPYFGKVIFKNENSSEPMELYFGKAAIDLDEGNKRVIDWRAPIADLYYKYTGSVKNAFFTAAGRQIKGNIKLKRQISIEEGLITMISDGTLNEVIKELENAQIGEDSTDEILITNLNKSAHKRLGEIVATIQSEQNEIIRAPLDKITLVQGVAGAGKTTVALHRLAYLMYNHPDDMKSENIMVIAPNDVFLDYISKVLPDLGVENVIQTTIENYLLDKINLPKNINFLNKIKISARCYEDERYSEKISSFRNIKCDFRMLDLIHNLHTKLESQIVSMFHNNPYYPIHSKKVTQDYIRQLFYENRNMPWERRIDYIKNRLIVLIQDEMKENSINPKSAKEKTKSETTNLIKFLSKLKYPSLLESYKMLFTLEEIRNINKDGEDQKVIGKIIQDIEQNIIYSDDLPLLYKISELYQTKNMNDFDYVVIDEAQDLSPTEIEILRQNTKPNKLCIVGDINQTIHDEARYSTLLGQMSEIFGKNSFSFHKLLKSYRSTIEITNFANNILKKLNSAHIAKPVIRHGPNPIIKNINSNDFVNEIKQLVELSKEKGRKSIAITAKTESEAKEIHKQLENEIDDIKYISQENKNYDVGVHIIPSYLTKGLEFDTVIILNNSDNNKTSRNLRLEYVMYTRALHELYILKTVS